MEGFSKTVSTKHSTDRNTKDAVKIQKPALASELSSMSVQSQNVSKGRENKIRDILVKRPLIPGAESAPPTVPRYVGLRG